MIGEKLSGFPDWSNEGQYPKKPDDLTYTQWAWEFLRRNKQYQEAFTKNQQIENAAERLREGIEAGKNFGLTIGLPNPWEFTSSEIADDKIFVDLNRLIVGDVNLNLPAHQVATVFDLRYPIQSQITHVQSKLSELDRYVTGKRLFDKHNKYGNLAQINNKVRADKYAVYLRILDAKSVPDIKNKEIASIIFKYLLGSKNGQSVEKKFEKAYKEAKYLRDGGYLQIGMKGSQEVHKISPPDESEHS